jgi:hypothetical protein
MVAEVAFEERRAPLDAIIFSISYGSLGAILVSG